MRNSFCFKSYNYWIILDQRPQRLKMWVRICNDPGGQVWSLPRCLQRRHSIKPSCFPAFSAEELSISGQVRFSYRCRISLSSLKQWRAPQWGASGSTGAILSAEAHVLGALLPMSWEPKTPTAFPKEAACWGGRESQVQHRMWVTNSRQRGYQFLEKEKEHLQTKKMASIESVQQKNQLPQELKCLSTHITSKARMQGGQSSSS